MRFPFICQSEIIIEKWKEITIKELLNQLNEYDISQH